MRTVKQILFIVFSAVLVATPARAQGHVADQATIDQAIAGQVQNADADRQAIRHVLQQPQVRETAGRVGLDLKRAETAVATLDGAELHEIAMQARAVDDTLAGGDSITISTTAIIIGLLLLILIIIAV